MIMAVRSLSSPAWPSIAIIGARGSRPLMAILFQMLAGGWGAWGRSGSHYGWVEVVFHPYTLLNNQLFIERGWNIGMNDEEAQGFGLQLWAQDDGSSIGSDELVLG
jgi:hypothetical protein